MKRAALFLVVPMVAACGLLADEGSQGDAGKHPNDASADTSASDASASDAPASDGADAPAEACPPGSTRCGDLCVDLATDTNNCGACGHDCAGTTCAGAVCTMTLVQSVAPMQLALDADHVYWTDLDSYAQHSTIQRAPKKGGELPTMLAWNQDTPIAIAVDSTSLYWTTNGDLSAIVKMPLGGGAVTTLTQNVWGQIASIALDATNVYWAAYAANGDVVATPLAGGSSSIYAAARYGASFGVVDSSYAYWSEEGGVMRVPIGGGTIERLAVVSHATALAIDAENLYWLDPGTSSHGYTDGAIVQMSLSTLQATTLLSNLANVSSLAVDNAYVYWTYYGTDAVNDVDGAVYRMPIGGGNVTKLASNQQYCYGLVMDATHLYWIDNFEAYPGTIMKLAK
jgi:hypothetical protein